MTTTRPHKNVPQTSITLLIYHKCVSQVLLGGAFTHVLVDVQNIFFWVPHGGEMGVSGSHGVEAGTVFRGQVASATS